MCCDNTGLALDWGMVGIVFSFASLLYIPAKREYISTSPSLLFTKSPFVGWFVGPSVRDRQTIV